MTKISVIVPCYNEEANIKPFYHAITDVFKGSSKYHLQIIFVNDGSKDETLKEMKSLLTAATCQIKIVSFSRNFGKEAAMYAGLKQVDSEYAVIIDADLQQNPKLIMNMLKVLEEEPEYDSVVYYQESRKESGINKFFKDKFYWIINKFSEVEFVSGASDFRLFRRNVVDAILELPETGRFSKGIFAWVGFKKKYLPYTPEPRASGKTKWSFSKLFKYALSGITSFSDAPLKLASYLGGIISVLSFAYLMVIILQKLIWGIVIPGYPTIVGLILFLGGIQLFCLGIIGKYISKTFLETKRRPVYIAKETYDNAKISTKPKEIELKWYNG